MRTVSIKILRSLCLTCLLSVFIQVEQVSAAPVISELYPAPNTGESEWIELYNPESSSITLSGMQLYDQLSSPSLLYTFGESETLAPGAYLQIILSSAKLNNSADGVTLKAADGSVIDSLSYTSTETGTSWQRVSLSRTELVLTSPTPGATAPEYPLQSLSPAGPTPTPEPTATPTSSPTPSVTSTPSTTSSPTPTASPSPQPTSSPSPTPSPTPQPTATPTPLPSFTPHTPATTLDLSTIMLTEIMPCPQSGQEWIELYYSGTQPLTLENWRLLDASGNLKLLSATLQPNSYTQLSWSNSLLNNAGDSLTLETPDETLVISTSFTDCTTGQSLVYTVTSDQNSSSGQWVAHTPSPGKANPQLSQTNLTTTGTASIQKTAGTSSSEDTSTASKTAASQTALPGTPASTSLFSSLTSFTNPANILGSQTNTPFRFSLADLNKNLFATARTASASTAAEHSTPIALESDSSTSPTQKTTNSHDTTTQSPLIPPSHAILAGSLFSITSLTTTLYAYPSLLQAILTKVSGLTQYLGAA